MASERRPRVVVVAAAAAVVPAYETKEVDGFEEASERLGVGGETPALRNASVQNFALRESVCRLSVFQE